MNYGMLHCNNLYNDDGCIESAGFHQWLKVFGGQVIHEDQILTDGDFDIIHLRMTRENLSAIERLRNQIGNNSITKIVASIDLPEFYWKQADDCWDRLLKALEKADIILATDFNLVQKLSQGVNRRVYELPHPIDLDRIRSYQKEPQGKTVIVADGRPKKIIQFVRLVKLILGKDYLVKVLSYPEQNPIAAEFYRKKKVESIICRSESELLQSLAECRMILIPDIHPRTTVEEQNRYDYLIKIAAALGLIVLGEQSLESLRRCYPEMLRNDFRKSLLLYRWISSDPLKIANVIDNAQVKVQSYGWGILQKKLLDILYHEFSESRFYYREQKLQHRSLFHEIHHHSGVTNISYQPEELVVVCLVKNGADYIPSFLEHYRRLGIKHFFFIDNGSDDETLTLLDQSPDITVYRTELPHKKYECEIRRAIIEENCYNRWCLCVDIDELFDYPYSKKISLREFLVYLNTHKYTAVLSYMLDMFAKKTDFNRPGNAYINLTDEYCYYDISNVKKTRYDRSFIHFSQYNRMADPKMMNYSGGIRRSFFRNKDSGYLLTKHPLIFVDHQIEPFVHPHFSNKAYVADVNGVLKHYKFIATFKEQVIRRLEAKEFCYYGEREYQEYYKVIKDENSLNLYSPQAKKLEQVEELLEQGFLIVSKAYCQYMQELETRRGNK